MVVRPGCLLKWVVGSSPCVSTRCDSSSATMDVASLAIELRIPMGLYALGMSYWGFPGFYNTHVMTSCHWPKKVHSLNIARKICFR